jgi:CheY-like chemotaxis protein
MNARDAMPRGGRLVITTANAEIEAEGEVEGVAPGSWVTLEVRDSGVGMNADTVSHIFEPFFSTKEARRGTGLGLSTVAAIAQQSGGHVGVESAPGQGSTFTVYLPQVDAAEPSRETPAAPTDLRGSETVLLVEDDKAVRSVLRRDLERHGYTVIDAPSANEALSRLKRHEGPLDLLVTDVVLPGTDGPTLANQLQDGSPELRVVYITGGSDENLAERGVSTRDDVVLQKPLFTPALLYTLREVLDSPLREPPEPPPEE